MQILLMKSNLTC